MDTPLEVSNVRTKPRLVAAACVAISFFVVLVCLLLLEPAQGHATDKEGIGFTLILSTNKSTCYHIHHWCVALFIAVVVLLSLACAEHKLWWVVYVVMGGLAGLAASDLKYTDILKFRTSCHIGPSIG